VGARPARLDVVLGTDRLAGIVDHQAADMTVTVEAGCPLRLLAATLAKAGQWLPLDPPRAARTTVGGLVAANLSGPLRTSQGSVRDYLIGIQVVEADGAFVQGGGRVVKNVAGYDLPKLHVGALGTLGVIVEATFKVRPRPEKEEAVVVECGGIGAAADLAHAVLDLDVPPLWVAVAGPGALPDGPGHGAAVAVGHAGLAEEVAAGRDLVRELARVRGRDTLAVPDAGALRSRLGDFPIAPAAAVLRAAALPAGVGPAIDRIAAEATHVGAAVRVLAEPATGVVRVLVAEPAPVAALVRALRARLEIDGGSLVVERAVPAVKAEVDVWGDPGPGLELMRTLKAAFDPAGALAPGRFVGGI
jgi:glycolate oxidase FAD binding subunit